MKRGEQVIKIYSYLYIISTIIVALFTVINKTNYTAVEDISLDMPRIEIFFVCIIHILPMVAVYQIYLKTKKKKVILNKGERYQFIIDEKKIHIVVFGLVLFKLYYTITFGYGVTLTEYNAQEQADFKTDNPVLNMVLNMLNIDAFFPIYYVCCRTKNKFLYWVNSVLYIVFNLMSGWTSVVLLIPMLEFYLYMRKHNIRSITRLLNFKIPLVTSMILGGGLLYTFLYPFKIFIREGFFVGISYKEGLINLVLRLTNLPYTILAYQNHSEIATMFRNQGVLDWESRSIFRTLVPSFLMQNKEYRTMDNLVVKSLYPTVSNKTGTGYGIIVYLQNLLEASWFSFILWIVTFLILFVIGKKMIQAFDSGNGETDILYFMMIFSVATDGALEQVFIKRYIGMIYLAVMLICIRVIKIEKVTKMNSECISMKSA